MDKIPKNSPRSFLGLRPFILLIVILSVVMVLAIAGCSKPKCEKGVLQEINASYNLDSLKLEFVNYQCTPIGYAGSQDIESDIVYNGQVGKLTYSRQGGGSGGWVQKTMNISIPGPASKNKDLYQNLSATICDYFLECAKTEPSLGVMGEAIINQPCMDAYNSCMNQSFEKRLSDGTVVISITYHGSRDGEEFY